MCILMCIFSQSLHFSFEDIFRRIAYKLQNNVTYDFKNSQLLALINSVK